ncbi:MAG: BrnT family toxin [Betaproteobacteria bacterium]|nr:BrnT family toxin [Betaproteobacteria bacterium]
MVTYDETKRAANLSKHGLDLAIAGEVLAGFTITQEDTREGYGETRLKTLGLYKGVVVVVVIHTPRDGDDHIISIRKADSHETRYYWQHYPS